MSEKDCLSVKIPIVKCFAPLQQWFVLPLLGPREKK
jgi:hypothetical protein